MTFQQSIRLLLTAIFACALLSASSIALGGSSQKQSDTSSCSPGTPCATFMQRNKGV